MVFRTGGAGVLRWGPVAHGRLGRGARSVSGNFALD